MITASRYLPQDSWEICCHGAGKTARMPCHMKFNFFFVIRFLKLTQILQICHYQFESKIQYTSNKAKPELQKDGSAGSVASQKFTKTLA